jgi:hypothetical protein
MSAKACCARNLAAAFVSGAWSLEALCQRGAQACGGGGRWLRPLVRRVLEAFTEELARRSGEAVAAFIESDAGFGAAWRRYGKDRQGLLRRVFWLTPTMTPAHGAPASWPVPALPTPPALESWLELSPTELVWLADCHGQEADLKEGPLRHYTYSWLRKRSGQWRLLERPKGRLKALQRRLLHEILDRISPHDSAHGYRRGRSIATFAAPHCGRALVLPFDLRHFFPSVRRARVHSLFRTAGYPTPVARLLTGLCTNVVPEDVWRTLPPSDRSRISWEEQQLFRSPHLAQGAPTSPALANLCAFRLDCRLHGLARSLGAVYTRYADDLAFSGGEQLELSARRFQVQVCRIALEEGFEVHTRKSRFMRRGVRQQLVGVVVNHHLNLCREEYDRLKAILNNCVCHGPASQNREGHPDFRGHLLGRIAHATLLNPARGERLRCVFERICWE